MNVQTLREIKEGDVELYGDVVREHQEMLLGFAVRRLADWNTAADVVQLTFIRAWEQIDEFRPDGDFGTWLRAIAKHLIMAELERRRRESRNVGNYENAVRMKLGSAMLDGSEELQDEEQLSALGQCLKTLGEEAAKLVQLRYHDRCSCREIAQRNQRSVTWVTSTLSRTRQALRKCVESRLSGEAVT